MPIVHRLYFVLTVDSISAVMSVLFNIEVRISIRYLNLGECWAVS